MKWIGQQIYDEVVRFRNDVYFEADNITFQSANADDPIVTIKNTSNDTNDMASLKFVKDRGAAPTVGTNLAEIYFMGEDSNQAEQEYGRILCEIDVATHGQESGALKFGVANHDGDNGYGLVLTGGSVDGEVDVTVGLGAASVTTLAGTLTMGSTATINNSGVIQVAAQTVIDHDQLANYAANEHFTQANITTVGTIGTGVWQGTAIASAYLDSDTAYLSGTQTFTGNKSFSGTTTFTNDANGRPSVSIGNTGNNANGGTLHFRLDKGAVGADNDVPGYIEWKGDNDAQEQIAFGQLYTMVADATDGQEAGAMFFKVAEYDGTLTTGLKIDGNTDADGEIDVGIGAGAASVTTIHGTLTMGTTATLNNSGLLQVAGQTNITSVGTLTGLTTSGAIELGHANDTTVARSSAGVITVEGKEVRTIDRHLKVVHSAFKADIGTTAYYIPWHTEDENTSNTNENIPFLAPYAGKLLELHYRVSTNTSGATATWSLVQIEKTEVINTVNNTTLDTQTCTGPTNTLSGAGNVVKVTFDSDAAFNAGDLIALSIQHDSDVTSSSTKFYITTIWEYDLSSM